MLVQRTMDLAIRNDCDFSVVAGEACLQITKFRLRVKKTKNGGNSTLDEITVATGFKKTLDPCGEHLGNDCGVYKAAAEPLLDGIDDLRSRCLIAVMFANDTFPSELKRHTCFDGVGPAAVRNMLTRVRNRLREKSNEELAMNCDVPFDDLLTEAVNSIPSKNKNSKKLSQLPRAVIKALVEAMAYEPAAVAKTG
jgi:hypothetical protein